MESKYAASPEFNELIERFLDEFISTIYKGHDHIVARNYYRGLFQSMIPKYFCMCRKEK